MERKVVLKETVLTRILNRGFHAGIFLIVKSLFQIRTSKYFIILSVRIYHDDSLYPSCRSSFFFSNFSSPFPLCFEDVDAIYNVCWRIDSFFGPNGVSEGLKLKMPNSFHFKMLFYMKDFFTM